MQEKKDLLTRLKKVEGQIRGIQKMIEDERECSDVIRQVLAASKALDKVGFLIVNKSLKSCIAKSVSSGEEPSEVFDEAVKMLFGAAKNDI